MDSLINRTHGLGPKEKQAIFSYVIRPQEIQSSQKEYITNLIVIVNSFYEYGYIRHKRGIDISRSDGEDEDDEYDDEEDLSQDDRHEEGTTNHYWEYVMKTFSDLETVRYINFFYDEASSNKEKALGWVMLALNTPGELRKVFLDIFNNMEIVALYRRKDSYIWKNRKEVLDSIDALYTRADLLKIGEGTLLL